MHASEADRRLCEHCLKVKPIGEFRRRSAKAPSRMKQCRECHNAAEKERRVYRKFDRDQRRMRERLAELKDARSNRNVEVVLGLMSQEFGGLQGFAEVWSMHYAWAKSQRGYPLFRCLQAYRRAVEYYDSIRATPRPGADPYGQEYDDYMASLVSDEDLERERVRATQQSIRENPQLAIDAAKQLGWIVIPPTRN